MQKLKGKTSIQNSKLLLVNFIFIFYFFIFGHQSVALAHETQSNNGIGAILHVDPGDAPIAGQESTLFFEFTDMEDKLDLNNCICSVMITRDGQEVLKQDFTGVPGTEGTSGVVEFVFPEAGVYKTVVTGNPKEDGQFKPFKLNFSTRVEKDLLGTISEAHDREHNTWLDHVKHYSITIITIFFLLLAFYFTKHKKKIAVIFLALVLVSHLLPVKAIHASHSGPLDSQSYECCIPQATVIPELSSGFEVAQVFNNSFWIFESKELVKIYNSLNSRSPPSI